MQQVDSIPKEGQWMARQRRPAPVARFLNKIPLDDRHTATNALLMIGLRAYEKALPGAPASLEALNGVASQLPSSLKETQTSLASGGTPPRKTESSSVCEEHQQAMPNSAINYQHPSQPPLLQPHLQTSQNGAVQSSLTPSHPKRRTAALSFVLEEARRCPTSHMEYEEEEPNGVGQDLSTFDVSEGTVSEDQSGIPLPSPQVLQMEGGRCQRTRAVEDFFPLEFLSHLQKRIENTRGIRENPITVAASIPQELAIYTTRERFAALYQSSLISYHLSTATAKD